MYTELLGPISKEGLKESDSILERAVRLLQQGGLVGFPTETVYGLGVSVLRKDALKRLFAIKQRPTEMALPVLVANIDQVKFIARDIPQAFYVLAREFLPGPLTIILKKNQALNPLVTGGKETVAIRMSSNPITRRLIELTGCPLAVPSANLTGKPSPTKAKHVLEDFNGDIEAILDGGESSVGLESTVVSIEDPENPVILRLGPITHSDIEKALGSQVKISALSCFAKNRSRRYPIVRLFSTLEEVRIYLQLSSDNKRLLMSREKLVTGKEKCESFILSTRNLYEGLRFAQRESCSEVLVLCDNPLKQNGALFSRLKQIAST